MHFGDDPAVNCGKREEAVEPLLVIQDVCWCCEFIRQQPAQSRHGSRFRFAKSNPLAEV